MTRSTSRRYTPTVAHRGRLSRRSSARESSAPQRRGVPRHALPAVSGSTTRWPPRRSPARTCRCATTRARRTSRHGRLALAGGRQRPQDLRGQPHHRAPSSGHRRRRVHRHPAVRRRGARPAYWRDRDLESIAYDGANDTLYVFSGSCCTTSNLPTVFRLRRDRQAGSSSTSYRPCPRAATSPERRGTRRTGSCTSVTVPTSAPTTSSPTPWAPPSRCRTSHRITGMQFHRVAADLYVSHALTKVSRINWATKKLVAGWTFDLSSFGVHGCPRSRDLRRQALGLRRLRLRCDETTRSRNAVFVFRPQRCLRPTTTSSATRGSRRAPPAGTTTAPPGVTLERVAGGHSGSYAARLTNTNATATT